MFSVTQEPVTECLLCNANLIFCFSWEQRLQEERDRAADLSEWRINKLQETYKERNTQRKRQRQDSESESDTIREKLSEVETKLKDKEYEVEQLQKQVGKII